MFHKPLDREHPASGGNCRYSRIRQWTDEVFPPFSRATMVALVDRRISGVRWSHIVGQFGSQIKVYSVV